MGTPLVSILLPTYNGARYIREAIDSVLAQNFSDFELIIIDDASVDGVSLIIEEYLAKDARVVSYRNDKNMKLVTTLNVGLQVARGQYIARIDDDDIWNSREKLQKQVEILECSPRVAIVGTFGYIIDEESKRTGQCIMHHTDA